MVCWQEAPQLEVEAWKKVLLQLLLLQLLLLRSFYAFAQLCKLVFAPTPLPVTSRQPSADAARQLAPRMAALDRAPVRLCPLWQRDAYRRAHSLLRVREACYGARERRACERSAERGA